MIEKRGRENKGIMVSCWLLLARQCRIYSMKAFWVQNLSCFVATLGDNFFKSNVSLFLLNAEQNCRVSRSTIWET